MLRFLLITVIFATCQGNIQVSPPVRCGEIPSNMHGCIGSPQVIKHDISVTCSTEETICQKLTCAFTRSGWLKNNKLDKEAVKESFDSYAKVHPEWSLAVQKVKSSCLSADLPSQSVEINCPAYDVMICSYAVFIKNVQPSQWLQDKACDYARQFAAVCPYCPTECFAPLVPIGSCNSCQGLPRSP